MSSDHSTEPTRDEQIFLARLVDVPPVAESFEQVHVTAAVAAVRDAGVTAEPSRRAARRPTAPLWRKPRMALSKIAAIVAGLSLPAKAFAATAVAAAAVGAAAVTLPPATPDAASSGLEEASENAGFEVPAHGQPEGLPRGDEDDVTTDEVTGEESNAADGQATAEEAKEDGRLLGQTTASEASDGQNIEAQEQAAEARAEAQARREAAAERERAEAEAQARAAAEERRAQARANARAAGDADSADQADTSEDDEDDGTSATGTERSGEGRARAGGASGR